MKVSRLLFGWLAVPVLLAITTDSTHAQDYTVATTAGVMTVTDVAGNGDTLTVFQPAAGQIRFAAAGRTFSVNGGAPLPGDSGNLSLTGVTSITVSAGAGHDTTNVGAFAGATFPSLTIYGGAADDTVNLTGDITFASGHGLGIGTSPDSETESVNVAAGANVLGGTGAAISVNAARHVSLVGGASLETDGGQLTVKGNRGAAPSAGNFIGVSLSGVGTMLNGKGRLFVEGRGGNDPAGNQIGVLVNDGAKILGSVGGVGGAFAVYGFGGESPGPGNRGVLVTGAGSAIAGPLVGIAVVGVAGAAGSGLGTGVSVLNGGEIAAAGVNVNATGQGAAGSGSNHGLEITGTGSLVTAATSFMQLSCASGGAPAGASGSWGLFMAAGGAMNPASGGPIIQMFDLDSISLESTASIAADLVTFYTARDLDLGGADTADTLGVTDAELDRIFASRIQFVGLPANTDFILSAPISRAAPTDLAFYGGEEEDDKVYTVSGRLRAVSSGTELSLGGGTLTLNTRVVMPIAGPTAETDFPQLRVAGGITLQPENVPAVLDLTGTSYPATAGESFTIIENDGTDPIMGTFAGLPEDATIAWPGSPEMAARISYVGGTGNDVVLTLISLNVHLEVTNTDDSGPGSLRAALAGVAAGGVVTFSPSLAPTVGVPAQIIFGSEFTFNALPVARSVTIDGSGVPGGVLLDGGPGSHRLLSVAAGRALDLTGLSFTGGNGAGALDNGFGGAIRSRGILRVTDCSFFGNSAPSAGGAISGGGTFTRCLFSGNAAGGSGGAIAAGSVITTDCTFTENSAVGGGGAISLTAPTSGDYSPTTILRCTFAGNSAQFGGALSLPRGTHTLQQCTLSGNMATSRGGAVDANRGSIITNSVAVTLRHCTVAGNSAGTGGGGVELFGGPLRVENSIVAGNTSTTGARDISLADQYISWFVRAGRNVIGTNMSVASGFPAGAPNLNGDYVGTDAGPMDPLLAPLGDYGGLTQTRALLPGSPARDHSSGSTVTSDQRGFPLVGVPDVGAYEAGTFVNFNTFIWETLPAAAAAAQRDAAFDFDGDGATNMGEWLALTDAADGASYLRISAFARAEPNVTVTFPSVVGRSYMFETSTDLEIWTPIAGPSVAGTGAPLAVQLGPFPGVPQLFVRVHPRP